MTDASSRYQDLSAIRAPYLDRARDICSITIPYLLRQSEDDGGGQNELPEPNQGFAGKFADNLANKFLQALFPPTHPFFKYRPGPFSMDQILREGGVEDPEEQKKVKTAIGTAFGRAENAIMAEVERMGLRIDLKEALLHLLLPGNVCLKVPPDGKPQRVYHLDKYVCLRNYDRELVELIVKDPVVKSTLPMEIQELLTQRDASNGTLPSHTGKETVCLYEWWRRDEEGTWTGYQYVEDILVPDSESTYPKGKTFPYMVLRGIKRDGEHYGRSFAEVHWPTIRALEGLWAAVLKIASQKSLAKIGIRPGAICTPQQLMDSGDFFAGQEGDFWALQFGEKNADLQAIAGIAERLERFLGEGFLSFGGMRRDAERVTAQEMRMVAKELESGVNGLYTILGQTLQLPLAKLIERRLVKRGEFPEWPQEIADIVSPSIVTGFSALGGSIESDKRIQWASDMINLLGEQASRRLRSSEFMEREANDRNLSDVRDLMFSDEQIDQQEQAAQQQAAQQQVGQTIMEAGLQQRQ